MPYKREVGGSNPPWPTPLNIENSLFCNENIYISLDNLDQQLCPNCPNNANYQSKQSAIEKEQGQEWAKPNAQ
jgi:hypothetical protein